MTYFTETCASAPTRPTLFSGLATRFAVWRQRRALASLDGHALDDIGLTQSEATAETRRSFWDAPESWHH